MVSIHGTPFDPVPVQYVFPVALGHSRVPQSPAEVQPSITQSHALVQVMLPQLVVPVHVLRQRPALPPPVCATPHVMSLHALPPEHVIRQSAEPHVMLWQAVSPVHVIVHEAAPAQLMSWHWSPVHVISQWWPGGQVALSPLAPLIVHVGGFAVRSQPPLHWAGHALTSITQ